MSHPLSQLRLMGLHGLRNSSALSAGAASVLVAISIARIVATYSTFNQTYDEPAHVARGALWLQGGPYLYPLHPPLGPVAFAFGPVFSGVKVVGTGERWRDGNEILYTEYPRMLTLARSGNLVFFVWAAVAVWCWSCACYGPMSALFAVMVFTMLPPVLAHAALATTDMAITASLCTSVWLSVRWLDRCVVVRSFALGISIGLTLLSKLSAVVFLPGCFVAVLVSYGKPNGARRPLRDRMIHGGMIVLAASCIVWMGYRFSFGPTYVEGSTAKDGIGVPQAIVSANPLVRRILEISVPAPEFFRGLTILFQKNDRGHAPYFLGTVNSEGSLAFFPVVLSIKTPIAFAILFVVGSYVAVRCMPGRRAIVPLACFAAILDLGMMSRINLGIRHLLPLYPMFSICAGLGMSWLWNSTGHQPASSASSPSVNGDRAESTLGRLSGSRGLSFGRILMIVLALWGITESILAHPDYLSNFNAFAGRHPENIVVDSDLDWGQDLDRLAAELSGRRIDHVHLAYFGMADVKRHGLPKSDPLLPDQPVSGYVAVSLTILKTRPGFQWLEQHRPIARIGRSIVLYQVTQTTNSR